MLKTEEGTLLSNILVTVSLNNNIYTLVLCMLSIIFALGLGVCATSPPTVFPNCITMAIYYRYYMYIALHIVI